MPIDFEDITPKLTGDEMSQVVREIRQALTEAPPPEVSKPVRETFAIQSQYDEADSKRADYLLSKPTSSLLPEELKELTAGIAAWSRAERR